MKPGYKQTEVGVIPEEWRPTCIGDIAFFSGGSQPPRLTFKFQASPGYIRLIQIRDYKSDEYETYVPESMVRKRCSAADIMIGRYGPPIFQILRGIEGAYNVALIKATPTKEIDRTFFYYILSQDSLFNLIESLSRRSSGQTGVEMPALKAFGFGLPPPPEQHDIASALGDADGLIESLERLIAKKRAIKQGAMQELLTGRRRLPGFKGEWTTTILGEVIEKFIGGGTPSRSNPQYWGDEIPWVTVKDFATHDPCKSQESITKAGLLNSASHLIPQGTLITSTRMALGKAVVYSVDVAINQDLKALFPKTIIVTQYLYYWFQHFGCVIDELGSGSTVKGISLADLKNVEFRHPSPAEQTAIVAVLADMDAEIAALEGKLAKARAIKQGMMQELLTGRIRLV